MSQNLFSPYSRSIFFNITKSTEDRLKTESQMKNLKFRVTYMPFALGAMKKLVQF